MNQPAHQMSDEQANPLDPSTPHEPAAEVENVSVYYRSYQQRPTSLKETLIRRFKHGNFASFSSFAALSQVNFQVDKGSVVGIIGSNGCGKSTLLKVLAQVLIPTRGKVTMHGKVASLIELGAGFDPELNAVENIYLNGSLHKRTKRELKGRVEQIIEFADLGDFQLTPIKYYSSGMYARLGFSVAIDINPDILLVDEVLAVGDERFQAKCNDFFHRFIQSGRTLIIASHDLSMIGRLAQNVLLLSKGKLIFYGPPGEAIEIYRNQDYVTALTERKDS